MWEMSSTQAGHWHGPAVIRTSRMPHLQLQQVGAGAHLDPSETPPPCRNTHHPSGVEPGLEFISATAGGWRVRETLPAPLRTPNEL